MKKIIISVALIAAAAVTASAQFSISAGYINNNNNVTGLDKGISEYVKFSKQFSGVTIDKLPLSLSMSHHGGYVGVSYGIGLGDGGFKFTPGVQFQLSTATLKGGMATEQKKMKVSNDESTNVNMMYNAEGDPSVLDLLSDVKASVTTYDVVVPLKFSYEFETGGAVKPYIFVDPSVKYGIAFNIKGAASGIELAKAYNLYNPDFASIIPPMLKKGDSFEKIEKFGGKIDKYAKLNRLDVMLGGGFGMIISDHLGIEFGYNFGFLNKIPKHPGILEDLVSETELEKLREKDPDIDFDVTKFKFKTNTFFVGISYIF